MRITFDLKRDSLKAKFIPPDRPDLVYLIDTGADTPVWCKGLEELLDVFPGAEKQEPKYILSGFGREPELVDVCRIPEFVLTDEAESILYRNFMLAVTDRPQMNVDLILPSSIFDHMKLTIDRMTSTTYPRVSIEFSVREQPMFFRHIRLTEQQRKRLDLDHDVILQNVYAEGPI